MQDLTNRHDADALLREPEAVLLKHGALCAVSAGARDELAAFRAEHPHTPVYAVEVTTRRELSDYLAERLGVPHESPQALVLRQGEVVWHASHRAITAQALAGQVGS